MPRFIVTEIQRVLAVREVEGIDQEDAYLAFCNGEGKTTGKDGDITGSDLLSIEEVKEDPYDRPCL